MCTYPLCLILSILDEIEDVVGVLKDNDVPLSCWITLAQWLYALNRVVDFVKVLEEAQKSPAATNPPAMPSAEDENRQKGQLIQLYTTLAAHYWQTACSGISTSPAQSGSKATILDNDTKKSLFGKARSLYALADRIDHWSIDVRLGKAFLRVYDDVSDKDDQDALGKALQDFNYILREHPENVPGLLGVASIFFAQQQYEEALHKYRKVLELLGPNAPAQIRVGMGMCFHRLGEIEKARAAFERALELEPQNDAAHVALAIMSLNNHTPEEDKAANRHLTKAFKINQRNPELLNLLANNWIKQKKLDKAMKVAKFALAQATGANMREIQAHSYYHLGRIHHCKEDFEAAFRHYYQATVLAPDFILPHYGLGQMYLFKQDNAKAVSCFEKVHEAHPKNYETLKILASLYGASSKPKVQFKAIALLEDVTSLRPNDVEAWLMLAARFEADHPRRALDCYDKAQAVYESHDIGLLEPECLNNIGALRAQLGLHTEAKDALDLGLESCDKALKQEEDATYYSSIMLTLRYNLCRLLELAHDTETAAEEYKNIIRKHPSYVDCYLRLAGIERDRGFAARASVFYKDSLKYLRKKSPDPWILLGNMHLRKREFGQAQKNFEMTPKDKHGLPNDPYASLSIGNIWLRVSELPKNPKKEDEHRQKCLNRALNYFTAVLKKDSSNLYAANGIGCVLAAKGDISKAKDIFMNVREATNDMSDTWINLAHIHITLGQYNHAIKMYEMIVKRFGGNKDAEVLTYLARAYFLDNQFEMSRRTLCKALHINPQNNAVRYNIAISQQQLAKKIYEGETYSVADVRKAIENLQSAKVMFKELKVLSKQSYNPDMAKKKEQECSEYLVQAQNREKKANEDAYKAEELRRKVQKETEALRKEHEAAEKKERERKEAAEKEAEKRREMFKERKKLIEITAVSEEKKTRVKRKKGDINTDDEYDEGLEDDSSNRFDEKAKKQRTISNKRKKKVTGGSEDSGEESDNISIVKRRNYNNSKYKSKDIVSSSSSGEESSDEEGGKENKAIDQSEEEDDAPIPRRSKKPQNKDFDSSDDE
eukprot:UC4_evm1s1540